MTSAPYRCFSCERTTRTCAGPPKCRSSFCTRSCASALKVEVTGTLRPVNSTAMFPPALKRRSKRLLALRRGGDPQLLPVLRDRAPGDLDSLRPQALHDSRVRLGPERVLLGDEVGDLVLDRERRNIAAVGRVDAAVKE